MATDGPDGTDDDAPELPGEPLNNLETPVGRLIDLPIEEELKDSYLTYSMSVIVSRRCPTCATG